MCTAHAVQAAAGASTEALANLKACHEAAHYLVMHTRAAQPGRTAAAAKAATALLRYTAPASVGDGGAAAPVVPLDKALFLAGSAWREVRAAARACVQLVARPSSARASHCERGGRAQVPGHEGDAFALLNAWLDVTEAIEDSAPDSLDVSDLAAAGVPPRPLLAPPGATYATPAQLESAKAWVLQAAMQAEGDQTLSERACGGCGAAAFAGALACGRCGAAAEACAVTGYPIAPGELCESRGAALRVVADRSDFAAYVAAHGTCPMTGAPQPQVL